MTGVEAGRHGQPPVADAPATARHRAGGRRTGWARPAWVDLAVPALPAVLGLITGGYHAGVPPLWRDEAATKAIAGRSVGQILATMPHDDVVHGAYYLVVHVVIRLFGSSNGALRLPSVLAMGVACAFTALIAQRLCRSAGRLVAASTGMTAGLVFALLPATIRYAQEARSYAIVTMMATVATYLLLRAIDDGGKLRWAGYGAAIFFTGLFNIFGLTLLAAHGLTLLATAGRRPGRRLLGTPLSWLAAGVVATALTLPVVIMAYSQQDALSWMSSSVPVRKDVIVLAHLWAGSPSLTWPVFGLAALGAVLSFAPGQIAGRRDLSPGTVALPWLVMPPAVLLAVSTTHPVYDQRYVEFCLPGLAICAASGITWLWRLAATALGHGTSLGQGTGDENGQGRPVYAIAWLTAVPALAVAVALAIALQPADAVVRQPGYRPDDLELESQIIAANARPGDIVFYIPINDRIVSMPFHGPWQKLRDIARATSPVSSNTLYGTDVSPAELLTRFTHVTRVWVVTSSEVSEPDYLALPQATPLDKEEAKLIAAMREIHRWRDGDTELILYATR
jgi:mannosyltransferase